MSYRVVFTDHPFGDLDVERETLADLDVTLVDGEQTDEPLESLVAGADALLVTFAEIDAAVIDELGECRVVARGGIGLDNVDVEAATERGIPVTNVPDYCVPEVAAHTLALLLALERNVVSFDDGVRRGEWDAAAGDDLHRLSARTLGLVAFGTIGQAVAERAEAFDIPVVAFDPNVDGDEMREQGITPVDSFGELLTEADAVSLHAPLTDDTRHLVDEAALEQMDEDAYLINTARGGLVDEDALTAALDDGDIAGAALDVREREPPGPDDSLRKRDDVVLTPHAAYRSRESVAELRRRNVENVRHAFSGEPLENVANPDVL